MNELRGEIVFKKGDIIQFKEDDWTIIQNGQKAVVEEDCFDWEKSVKVRWIRMISSDRNIPLPENGDYFVEDFEISK
jgi:hypothetical protein